MRSYLFAVIILVLLSSVSLAQENRVISTIDSVVVPEGQLNIANEVKSETDNGLEISLGSVSNSLDLAVLAKNITFNGQSIDINVIVYPNSTWTYARLDGMLIVPQTPSIIDAEKTSFYPTSRQLHMSFDGTDEVNVYFKNYVSPRIVVADSSINWYFKDSRLNIKSNDIMKEVDVYWNDAAGEAVAIYDKRKAESLQYRISMLVAELPKIHETVLKLRSKNDELKKSLLSLEARINSVSSERDKLKDMLKQSNSTAAQMENKVSGNVIMSQSVFALAVIISIISLMLLLDTVFAGRKGE